MNAIPQAIPTHYGRCHFRSRLEARWAVFFDTLDLPWEYEREGYELPSGRYLPDFWLPLVNMWAEVKPEKLNGAEQTKAIELAIATRAPVLCLEGLPENRPYGAWECFDHAGEIAVVKSSYLLSNCHNYPRDEHRFYGSPSEDERESDTDEAVVAARSARFEFIEKINPAMKELINEYARQIRTSKNAWRTYEECKKKIVCACGSADEREYVLRLLSDAAGI